MISEEMSSVLAKYIANSITEERLCQDLLKICNDAKGRFSIIYMKGVDGAPDWLEFEHQVWALGEELRKLTSKKKALLRSEFFSELVIDIVRDDDFGKGRQPFVLLLGKLKLIDQDLFFRLLSCDEVKGHAVEALVAAKCPGFENEVKKLTEKGQVSWIRKAADKYLLSCS